MFSTNYVQHPIREVVVTADIMKGERFYASFSCSCPVYKYQSGFQIDYEYFNEQLLLKYPSVRNNKRCKIIINEMV